MANAMYPKTKALLLQGSINLLTANIKVVLLTASYVYSAAHGNLSDVTAGFRVATSPNLTTKTVGAADAAFHSDNVTFTAVTGSAIASLVQYVDTGTESTSSLIFYQDTGVTGLPLTPSGADIQLIVDGTNGWFKL